MGIVIWGVSDNEYVLRSMLSADNYWLFCHNRHILVHMVKNIIGGRNEWDLIFKEVFEVLGCRFQLDGKGTQRGRKDTAQRDGQLVARCLCSPIEKCFSENNGRSVMSSALH